MNLLPLIEDLHIVTKDLGVVKLGQVLNWAQKDLIETVEKQLDSGKPVRIIVLKARQIGISTIIEAIVFVLAMMLNNLRCLIIAHELDASEHLLSITTNYWNGFSLKLAYTPQFASQKRLGWKETNSRIQVTTAKNVAGGRSRTIHILHGSEVAFWPEPETLMTGLRQSIPDKANTIIFLESTANGLGDYFETTWTEAVDGNNEYIPLFFPWHLHPEYTASSIGISFDDLGDLDDEERKLRGMGISDDRLAWRRWAIRNLTNNSVEQFHQEYPTTPEEAFVASGVNVFPLEHLNQVYKPLHGHKGSLVREGNRVRFQPDIKGALTIYKYPSDDTEYGIYMLGGDPTRTTRGDPACIQILNRRSWEQVAVWRAKVDPNTFAEMLARVGRYYNNAMICPEIEGPGYATIGALLQMDYPYIWKHQWADKAPGKEADTYGWSTTHKRKQWAIGNLLKAVIDHDITIHDSVTYNEMKNYVTLPNGEYGPATPSGHDDTVMALAISLTATITEAHGLPAYGSTRTTMIEKVMPPWQEWDDDREEVV